MGRISIATIATIALAGGAIQSASAANAPLVRSDLRPNYVGKFSGQRDSQIAIKVVSKHGAYHHGRVRIRNLELFCDDGEFTARDLPEVKIRFHDRAFAGDLALNDSDFQAFVFVEGRIRDDGRVAKGGAYWINNVGDPEPGFQDCGTGVSQGFRAERFPGLALLVPCATSEPAPARSGK
jgi:hypothetical protein